MTGVRRVGGRGERGAIAIVFAILCSLLFAFAALVVDLGNARDVRRQAQNAADAAALAGANAIYNSSDVASGKAAAGAAVQNYARDNFGIATSAWAGCTDSGRPAEYTPIKGPCISVDSATAPSRVRVHLPTTSVATPLASLMGFTTVQIAVTAEGAVDTGSGLPPCGLCVLSESDRTDHDHEAAQSTGGSGIQVVDSGIHVNGGILLSGGSVWTSVGGQIEYRKTPTLSGGSYTTPAPVQDTGPAWPDPLAFLWSGGRLPPGWGSLADRGIVDKPPCGTLSPGRFQDVTIANSCTVLSPGLYVVSGTFKVTGGNRVDATSGVTLFFTCGTSAAPRSCVPGERKGIKNLELSGGSTMPLKAPSSGPTKGLAIVFDKYHAGTALWGGGGGLMGSGTIYLPSGRLELSGGSTATTWDSLVVVNTFLYSGGSQVNLKYDAATNVDMPGGIYLSR